MITPPPAETANMLLISFVYAHYTNDTSLVRDNVSTRDNISV